MSEKDPVGMAHAMLGFNEQEWRLFLSTINSELNYPDSDVEGALFYVGKRLRGSDIGSLDVLVAALRAGARSPRREG